MKLDLDFFPALRDLIMSVPMIELRRRNARRLEAAKRTDGNIFRPTVEAVIVYDDEPYPRDEA